MQKLKRIFHHQFRGVRIALVIAMTLSLVLSGMPLQAVVAWADPIDETLDEQVGEPEGEQVGGEQESASDGDEGNGEATLGDETLGDGETPVVDPLLEGIVISDDQKAIVQQIIASGGEEPVTVPGDGGILRSVVTNPNPNNRVETVDNNDYGITLNLFDYDTRDNEDNHYGSPFTTNGINAGKSTADETTKLFFYGKGDLPGDHSLNAPNINLFAGFGSWSSNPSQNGFALQYALQGIVKRDLSGDANTDYSQRFPVVNTSSNESLAYLFDPAVAPYDANAKKSYTNVNHFFEDKDGYLYFSSNEHYAYYNRSQGNGGDFTIYEDTYRRYSGGGNNLAIGYFPFDEFNGGASGRGPSVPGACINPTTHPQWSDNNHVNHTMGMSMTVPITMPYDGQVEYIKPDGTTELKDMIFEFSGDDDMWVFIDGRLVLDIGGIHQPVKGTINFHTGQVEIASGTTRDTGGVDPRNQGSGQYNNQYSFVTGNFTMRAAGITDTNVLGTTSSIWKDTKQGNQAVAFPDDNRWPADTQHVVQFFYLERGGCDSNLEIQTNIHLRNERSASVEKVWDEALYDPEHGIDMREPVQMQLIRQAVMHEENEATGEHTVIGYTMFDHQGYTYDWNAVTGEWVLREEDLDGDGDLDPVLSPDNPVTLNKEDQCQWGWSYTWDKLASGGYNTNGWIDGLEEENENPDLTYDDDGNVVAVGNNVYCDYYYYVREVPNDDYTFVPRYQQVNADGTLTTLSPDDVPYEVPASGDQENGRFVAANNAIYPVRVTNEPVYIDVDKTWRNAAGTGPDSVNHSAVTNDDSVWVQLYCEHRINVGTEDDPVWEWGNPEAVGDAVKLDKSNEWKTSFLASPSQNIHYFVLEGTASDDGTGFTPTVTMTAAKVVDDNESGAPYVIDETWYTRDGKYSGGQEGVETTTHDQSETYHYYWQSEGTPGEEDYTVVRTFGGDAELMQRGGNEQQYTSDVLEVVLEVPAATAGAYTYKATVDLGPLGLDGEVSDIIAPDDVTPVRTDDGFEVQLERGIGAEAQTIKLKVPVTGALTSYSADAPAALTVTQTEYLPDTAANTTSDVSQTLHGSYLQLSETYTHGTATIANKPILMLRLRKMDGQAYAKALEAFAGTQDKSFADVLDELLDDETLKDEDWLKGAEFVMVADDGTMAVDDGTGKPKLDDDGNVILEQTEGQGVAFFDQNTDVVDDLRIPDKDTTFTTGNDGMVKLATLTEQGTYWLVEIASPTGYVNEGFEKPIQIVVDENGNINLANVSGTSTEPRMDYANGVYTVTMPNMRTYALPAAGGVGAYPFLLSGAFAAAFAVFGMRRRDRRGARL